MASIIKGNRPNGSSSHAQTPGCDDLHSDPAEALLAQARQEAERLLQTARQQASQMIEAAQQQGQQRARQEAEGAARAQLDRRLQSLLPALEQAAGGLAQAQDSWLQRWEQGALRLAIGIAERLIRRELQGTTDIPISLIREALELASGHQQISLHLHPDDRTSLGDRLSSVIQAIDNLAPVQIVADPQVSRGGCVVRTEFGQIDQQIEAQLRRIEEELLIA